MQRHARFEPLIYDNQELMDELNEFAVALKIWLFPERFGDKLADLHRRYPKPDLSAIDNLQAKLNSVLRKDAKPMWKY